MSTSSFPYRPFLISIVSCVAFSILPSLPAHAGPWGWTPFGPGAGYQDTGCVTVHPEVPGTVWACLPHGGLYRSADRGATWRWAGRPFTGTWEGASAMAADPARPNALWAATRSGFFRTEDGGASWSELSGNTYPSLLVEADPLSVTFVPGALYVASSRRLAVSLDGGSTWNLLRDFGPDGSIAAFAVDPARPNDLYLAGHEPEGPFFYRSSDAGNDWSDLSDRLFPSEGIDQLAATSTALYASVGGSIRGLFRSTDRGESWLDLLAGKPDAPAWVATWTLDPRPPRTLYAIGGTEDPSSELALWASPDEGDTWKKLGRRLPFPGRLAVDSAAGAFYVAGSEGLARSLDGGAAWKTVLRVPNRESSCAQISFQPEDPSRVDLVVGWTSWRSNNGGQSWVLRKSPLATDVDVDPEDPTRIVAVAGSYAYLSEDGGRTWRQTTSGLWYVESLTRVDRKTLLAAGAGLYRSGDNGETWQTVLPAWPQGSDAGRWAQKLEVDPGDPSKIYALTYLVDDMELPHEPLAGYPSILWKSTDSGRTWRKIALNLRAFTLDRGTSHLYGVRNRKLLESADAGKTWTVVARTPLLVRDLVIDPTDPDVFYVSGLGVLRSTDRGAKWKQVGTEYGVSETYALTLHPTDPRTLYAADRWGVREITVR